jgi:pentatricopeptide repeat protein
VADVFALQVEVAEEVARSLAVELLPGWKGAQRAAYRPDPKAHEHVLRGRYYWNKRSETGFRSAIEEFDRAIEIDPNYAAAYAGLADCHILMAVYAWGAPKLFFPRARAAAEKALELDATLGAAHASLGSIAMFYDWEFEKSEAEFLRCRELDPNYATGHQWYGVFYLCTGQFDHARQQLAVAHEMDPLSMIIMSDRGRVDYMARDYDETIRKCRAVMRMDPGFDRVFWDLGQAQLMSGQYDEAVEALEIATERSGGNAMYKSILICALAKAGRTDRARALLAQLMEERKTSYVSSFSLGMAHVGLGEIDEAMAWMERAYEAREFHVYFALDPMLDPLLADPRYEALLRRVGLRP